MDALFGVLKIQDLLTAIIKVGRTRIFFLNITPIVSDGKNIYTLT